MGTQVLGNVGTIEHRCFGTQVLGIIGIRNRSLRTQVIGNMQKEPQVFRTQVPKNIGIGEHRYEGTLFFGTIGTGEYRYQEHRCLVTQVPGNICIREQRQQGLLLPGNIGNWKRRYQVSQVSGTDVLEDICTSRYRYGSINFQIQATSQRLRQLNNTSLHKNSFTSLNFTDSELKCCVVVIEDHP